MCLAGGGYYSTVHELAILFSSNGRVRCCLLSLAYGAVRVLLDFTHSGFAKQINFTLKSDNRKKPPKS
jgi:hypothetical protein